MDFYSKFKLFLSIKSPRLKLAMLWAAQRAGMRYYGVYVDPVMACNIRCKMCYFSDPESRPAPEGMLSAEAVVNLARNVFPRALKLQIGCGAEPTLYAGLPGLVAAGKKSGVPYIELTTNAQLLTAEKLLELCDAGLNGMVLSLHGTCAPTYEHLMDGAKFDKLQHFVESLRQVRLKYPDFKLRINYTLNNLNKLELPGIWSLFDGVRIDVIQVRPIQKLGNTAYNDFDLDGKEELMAGIIDPFAAECNRRGITAILPDLTNLNKVDQKRSIAAEVIEQNSYIYISPKRVYADDYDCSAESLTRYQRRSGITGRLLRTALKPHITSEDIAANRSKKLNYNVK